jgi:hypothetical protein
MKKLTVANVNEFVLRGRKTLWFGALSFEERCLGALRDAEASRTTIDTGVLLTYETHVTPEDATRRLLKKHASSFEVTASKVFRSWKELKIDAYGFQRFQDQILAEIEESAAEVVVFDITCLTKINTLALAALVASGAVDVDFVVAYSIPENYRNTSDERAPIGWRDIIIAPLGETAQLFNEERGRGVIIPGHEPDRLVVALAEIEPSGGLILVAETDQRPDLRRRSEHLNQRAMRQLISMRSTLFRREVVSLAEFARVGELVENEIEQARQHDAPVMLFGYGPKPLVFFAALRLAESYPEGAWFVYPIPERYDLQYTSGVDRSIWYQVPTRVPASMA